MKISVGHQTYSYNIVEDCPSIAVGVAMNEHSLDPDALVRSATHLTECMEGTSETTLAVCSVNIGSPPMEVFTIVGVFPYMTEPKLGRFMIHDVITRTYHGHLVHSDVNCHVAID